MIGPGDRLPDVKFPLKTDEGITERSTHDLFGGKRMVLVGMPGAFTATCDGNHLPGLIENHEAILALGVAGVAVVCVNDPHVMRAWAKASGAGDDLLFLADVHGDFTRGMGMMFDEPSPHLGYRSKRYAAIVEDQIVSSFHPETDRGVTASSAAAILERLSTGPVT